MRVDINSSKWTHLFFSFPCSTLLNGRLKSLLSRRGRDEANRSEVFQSVANTGSFATSASLARIISLIVLTSRYQLLTYLTLSVLLPPAPVKIYSHESVHEPSRIYCRCRKGRKGWVYTPSLVASQLRKFPRSLSITSPCVFFSNTQCSVSAPPSLRPEQFFSAPNLQIQLTQFSANKRTRG